MLMMPMEFIRIVLYHAKVMYNPFHMNPTKGELAPDFDLPDQNAKRHKLADYRGTWLLLYFYPKDDTPGCTKEACNIRDAWVDYKKAGLEVLGVSTDSVASHKKFEEKFTLPFPLLADVAKKLVNAYGVWGEKEHMGRAYMGTRRTSFLINPEGRIVQMYENPKPSEHALEVLKDLRRFKRR